MKIKMRILITREKYGDSYYDASSDEALAKSCIMILKQRMEDGYWGYEPEEPKKEDVLTDEQIAVLPERLRGPEKMRKESYERELRAYKEDLSWFNKVKRCVETNSLERSPLRRGQYPLAYDLLCYREHAEYEGISLENLIIPK